MTGDQVKELFRVLANMPQFQAWIEHESVDVIRHLKAAEGNTFLRYQGRAALLDDMKRLCSPK